VFSACARVLARACVCVCVEGLDEIENCVTDVYWTDSLRCDWESVPVTCASGKGNKRRSKLCHRFVKRVAEVNFNFVTSVSVSVAHVFKSHYLIFGGN